MCSAVSALDERLEERLESLRRLMEQGFVKSQPFSEQQSRRRPSRYDGPAASSMKERETVVARESLRSVPASTRLRSSDGGQLGGAPVGAPAAARSRSPSPLNDRAPRAKFVKSEGPGRDSYRKKASSNGLLFYENGQPGAPAAERPPASSMPTEAGLPGTTAPPADSSKANGEFHHFNLRYSA